MAIRTSVLTAPHLDTSYLEDRGMKQEARLAYLAACEADKVYYKTLLTTQNEMTAMRAYCAALTENLDKVGAGK